MAVHKGRLRRMERAVSFLFLATAFVMVAVTAPIGRERTLGRRHKRPHGPDAREKKKKGANKWHCFDADMVPKG